jgi:hypothetical protein
MNQTYINQDDVNKNATNNGKLPISIHILAAQNLCFFTFFGLVWYLAHLHVPLLVHPPMTESDINIRLDYDQY